MRGSLQRSRKIKINSEYTKKQRANDWFVNMLLTPVQSSKARKSCCLPRYKILKAAMFPAPLADPIDGEMMSRLEVLFTDSDVPVAKEEVRGAVVEDQDVLIRRREAEWLRELEMFASAIEVVTCRADVERTWYDAKLEELRERSADDLKAAGLIEDASAARQEDVLLWSCSNTPAGIADEYLMNCIHFGCRMCEPYAVPERNDLEEVFPSCKGKKIRGSTSKKSTTIVPPRSMLLFPLKKSRSQLKNEEACALSRRFIRPSVKSRWM